MDKRITDAESVLATYGEGTRGFPPSVLAKHLSALLTLAKDQQAALVLKDEQLAALTKGVESARREIADHADYLKKEGRTDFAAGALATANHALFVLDQHLPDHPGVQEAGDA